MTKKVLCAVDDTEHARVQSPWRQNWRRPRVRNSLFLL